MPTSLVIGHEKNAPMNISGPTTSIIGVKFLDITEISSFWLINCLLLFFDDYAKKGKMVFFEEVIPLFHLFVGIQFPIHRATTINAACMIPLATWPLFERVVPPIGMSLIHMFRFAQ